MAGNVLVLNCGSTSVKYKVFAMPGEEIVAAGSVRGIGSQDAGDHSAAIDLALSELGEVPVAVGHRVVFGGEEFTKPALINDEVLAAVRGSVDRAPLHNPHNLAGVLAARHRFPAAAQVACFDTAFHMTIPPRAHRYAIPAGLYRDFGIRRFGFHGISHEYVAQICAQRLGKPFDELNAVTCHLGGGCSITAIENGRSVDTSMGFTPLAGLVMGTRSGDIDPAVVFHLARKGWALDDIEAALLRHGGLVGLSGISSDARAVLAAAAENEAAQLALDVFAHQARRYLAAYAAMLPRVDAVVFTGGIGEGSATIRAMIVDGLNPALGIELEATANAAAEGAEAAIGAGKTAVWVIPTDEELAIARQTWRLVSRP